MMVLSLCATVSTVQELKCSLMVVCIRASVCASTLAVASSSTRILSLWTIARARQTSWRSPTLKLDPPSWTSLYRAAGHGLNKDTLNCICIRHTPHTTMCWMLWVQSPHGCDPMLCFVYFVFVCEGSRDNISSSEDSLKKYLSVNTGRYCFFTYWINTITGIVVPWWRILFLNVCQFATGSINKFKLVNKRIRAL